MALQFNLILIFVLIIFTSHIFSQSINAKWPYDDSIQFPYPTRGPINIKPFRTKFVPTQRPVIFEANPLQLAVMKNIGTTLIVSTSGSSLATVTGGVLFNDTYNFFECNFYWDLSLKSSAADEVAGIGTPLQAAASFYNVKYGSLKKAMKMRDGIAQIVIPVGVGLRPNFLYYPFLSATQRVKNTGSTTIIFEVNAYDWYFPPSLIDYYYAYPGMYTDPDTGIAYYSATVMYVPRFPQPMLSIDQFNNSFGFILNSKGKPFSHTAPIVPTGSRPVAVARGVEYKLKFTK